MGRDCCLVPESCLTLYDATNCSPPGSSVHGISQGRNTGVGCHFLLQGIFPTQGLNRCLLHCRQILYHSEPPGKIGERLDQLYLRWGWLDWLIWSLLQLLQWLQLHLLSMTTILSFSKSLSFQGASAVLCCRWGNGGGHTDRTTHSTCISRIGLKCWNQCFVIILLFQPSILQK